MAPEQEGSDVSPEQATTAWRREIRRIAPRTPAALRQWIAEELAVAAGATLARLAIDLVAIADLVAEEAECRVTQTAEVIQLRRPDRSPDDLPPAAA
jgi:hypothetical protein